MCLRGDLETVLSFGNHGAELGATKALGIVASPVNLAPIEGLQSLHHHIII
jgi:hypothetical protein